MAKENQQYNYSVSATSIDALNYSNEEDSNIQIKSAEFENRPNLTINKQNDYWMFGINNLFPQFMARINRMSPINARIIKSKIRYILGNGFAYNVKIKPLDEFIKECNIEGTHLRDEASKILMDYILIGNAYIEIATDRNNSFLYLYHHDQTTCRLGKDAEKGRVLLHPSWAMYWTGWKYMKKSLPIFPEFEPDPENPGVLRSMIHWKEYSPEMVHYGLSEWITGILPANIDSKTLMWNYSLLENSFKVSGLWIIDGQFKDPKEAQRYVNKGVATFSGSGKQGKVMIHTINSSVGNGMNNQSKFIPQETKFEGDWEILSQSAESKLIASHNWFRALAGLADNTGFDTNRLKNEYDVALPSVIEPMQNAFLNMLYKILKIAGIEEEIKITNNPPNQEIHEIMKLKEACKNLGIEIDPNDPNMEKRLYELGVIGVKIKQPL